MVDLLEKGKYYRIEDPNFFMIGKVTLPNMVKTIIIVIEEMLLS